MTLITNTVESVFEELKEAKRLNDHTYKDIGIQYKNASGRNDVVSRTWLIKVAQGKDDANGCREFLENYIARAKKKYGKFFRV